MMYWGVLPGQINRTFGVERNGTENGLLAAAQRYFMADIESHIYGSSPHNQRREAWWSFYQRSKATWWINFFKDLMEQSAFTPGHDLQMECLCKDVLNAAVDIFLLVKY